MTVKAWIIFTATEKADLNALNDPPGSGGVAFGGREIDNVLANSLGEGTLVGLFVVGAQLLNDPDYSRWVEMCTTMRDSDPLPIRTMDSDVLFVPDDD